MNAPEIAFGTPPSNWGDIATAITSPFSNKCQSFVARTLAQQQRQKELLECAHRKLELMLSQLVSDTLPQFQQPKKAQAVTMLHMMDVVKNLATNDEALAATFAYPMSAKSLQMAKLLIDYKHTYRQFKHKLKPSTYFSLYPLDISGHAASFLDLLPKSKVPKRVRPTGRAVLQPRSQSAMACDFSVPSHLELPNNLLHGMRGKSCYCQVRLA